jgi:tetratricopeptide (TPR) repeat protein
MTENFMDDAQRFKRIQKKSACRILFFIGILLSPFVCAAGEEIWTEVKSPHFDVISNAPPKQARQTAKSFEQFRLLFQMVWPKLKIDPATPLTIFAGKDEKSYKALLSEERKEKGAVQSAGIFISVPERQLVVLNLDVLGDRPYHIIYHEYVHMIMRLNFGSLPLWLSEGLAELFANADISDKAQSICKFNPESAQLLRTAPMIPLSTLMSITPDSPYYSQEDKVHIFYAQSWALAHYLYLGDKSAHQEKLNTFIKLIMDGVPEREASSRAFGDFKDLEKALNAYLAGSTYYVGINTQLKINEDQYKARILPPAETLAYLGELLVHNNKLDRAQTKLEEALKLDPKSTRANEGMGYLYMRLKNGEQAARFFATATELDPKNCLAHYFAAKAVMSQDSEYATATVEKHLRKAISINPQFAPAYGQLSKLLAQKKMFLDEALEYANKAAALEPGRLAYQINIAYVLAAMDKVDEAYDLGRRILAATRDPNDRLQAESFLGWINNVRDRDAQFERMKEQQQKEVKEDEERFRAYNEAEKKRKTESARFSKLKTGSVAKLVGSVKSVKCDFPAIMDVILDANSRQYKLHAENYYNVAYGASGGAAKTGFEPCQDLDGKEVEIEYLSVSDEDFSGFIKSVVIMLKK